MASTQTSLREVWDEREVSRESDTALSRILDTRENLQMQVGCRVQGAGCRCRQNLG